MKISQYAKLHNVTYRTVWNWVNDGKVLFERTKTGRINILSQSKIPTRVAIYARVSSSESKDNLDKQVDRLISYANAKGYKVEVIAKEIGSGLNDKREKLEKILIDESINIIIVEHKDRLARFGLNYIEKLLSLQGRKLEIVNNLDSPKDDLMSDFVSIVTSFCARLYGLRISKRKTEQLIKELEERNE